MPASIFVFSDLHLGLPGAPGVDWALQELEVAANRGATACVCLGDIIDRNANSAEFVPQVHTVMAHAVTLFSEVHFISGNHDTHHNLDFPPEVTVHGTQVHTFHIGNTTVLTAAVATDPDPRRLQLPPRRSNRPVLGLLHSSVSGEFSKGTCLPLSVAELQACEADAWILGHVHTPHTLADAPFIGWIGMGHGLLFDPDTCHVTRLHY